VYETGHAKNVANFETLISFVSGYGAAYNPSRVSIQLGNLQAKATESSNVMNQVNTLIATHGNAIASREVAFKPLQKLSTKMHSALKATEVSTAVIENMTSLNRKVQGKRASAKETPKTPTTLTTEGAPNQDPNTKPVVQISSSQLSYDSILDTFDKQVKLLGSITAYNPNETELTVGNLQNLYNQLKAENAAVVNTATQLSNARLNRNQVMYDPETGIVATAMDVKNYVKSLFGATNASYKQISSLEFRLPKT
jgi:hypothetical protein